MIKQRGCNHGKLGWVVGGSSMCNEGYLEGVKVSSSTLHDKVKPHPILGTRHVLQSFQCALSVRP